MLFINTGLQLVTSPYTESPAACHPCAGSKVTAGTLNCDGSFTVRAEQSGQETVIADIVRMVESAQARTAPIQRLADTVAGRFSYGVMGLSAATFAFWSTVGTKLFPHVSKLQISACEHADMILSLLLNGPADALLFSSLHTASSLVTATRACKVITSLACNHVPAGVEQCSLPRRC